MNLLLAALAMMPSACTPPVDVGVEMRDDQNLAICPTVQARDLRPHDWRMLDVRIDGSPLPGVERVPIAALPALKSDTPVLLIGAELDETLPARCASAGLNAMVLAGGARAWMAAHDAKTAAISELTDMPIDLAPRYAPPDLKLLSISADRAALSGVIVTRTFEQALQQAGHGPALIFGDAPLTSAQRLELLPRLGVFYVEGDPQQFFAKVATRAVAAEQQAPLRRPCFME